MAKRFPKELDHAWLKYQDLYDRYMRLLRRLGSGDVAGIYEDYEAHIRYASDKWSPPEDIDI